MEGVVPLPQAANGPRVCEIYLCTGVPDIRRASAIRARAPGGWPSLRPVMATILTCNYSGNSSLTGCEKKEPSYPHSPHSCSISTHLLKQQRWNFASKGLAAAYIVLTLSRVLRPPAHFIQYPWGPSAGVEIEAGPFSDLETSVTLVWLRPPGPLLLSLAFLKAFGFIHFYFLFPVSYYSAKGYQ